MLANRRIGKGIVRVIIRLMRNLISFLLGAAVAATIAWGARPDPRIVMLNHVGVNVSDFQRSLDFYTKTLGFREAFVLRDDQGRPNLAYLQVSRNSFVELLAVAENRRAGLAHLALEVENLREVAARLRENGVKVEEPRMGRTKALLTFFTDPEGNRIELLEFGPEAMQRKAVEQWK